MPKIDAIVFGPLNAIAGRDPKSLAKKGADYERPAGLPMRVSEMVGVLVLEPSLGHAVH